MNQVSSIEISEIEPFRIYVHWVWLIMIVDILDSFDYRY